MDRTGRLVRLATLIVASALLAGCTSASVGTGNFTLTPDRIGWNVGDEGAFTLLLESSLRVKEPEFVVDPDFAIAELALNRKGVGFGGYSTKNAADVGLHLERNGTTVDEAVLDPANPDVTLKLTLPDDLADAEYVLELRLFEVGWVKSAPFRVNVP